MPHISYNIGTYGLLDICIPSAHGSAALMLWVYISGKPILPALQILHGHTYCIYGPAFMHIHNTLLFELVYCTVFTIIIEKLCSNYHLFKQLQHYNT